MNDRPVALLTGASRGIGAATAVELARRGYDLTLLARTAKDLDEVAGRVRGAGGAAFVTCGDLADLAFAEAAVARTAEQYGRIDALVNNAAWREIVTMRTISVESWEKTLRISLTAPAFLARWCAVHMDKRGAGVIVNVSSVQSQRASGIAAAYIAAKGGLDALTYDLAALYGPRGIRVVAINPGAIDTEMSGDYESSEGENLTQRMREHSEDEISLRRWGQPEEMARTIAFLLSEDASYITGTTIFADGGLRHQFGRYSNKRLMFPQEY
jgi:NAD(P)-dependent dehydrogenase (short-subunit alcohol dehydrogenase family)